MEYWSIGIKNKNQRHSLIFALLHYSIAPLLRKRLDIEGTTHLHWGYIKGKSYGPWILHWEMH